MHNKRMRWIEPRQRRSLAERLVIWGGCSALVLAAAVAARASATGPLDISSLRGAFEADGGEG